MRGSMRSTRDVDGIGDFAGVKGGHGFHDGTELAGLFADLHHLDHDAGDLAGSGEGFGDGLAALDRFDRFGEELLVDARC